MKNLKEQKPDIENVQAVDVELNEEQLDVVAGGNGFIDSLKDTLHVFLHGPKIEPV